MNWVQYTVLKDDSANLQELSNPDMDVTTCMYRHSVFSVDCSAGSDSATLSCDNDSLVVSWSTNVTYNGSVTEIPAYLYNRLTDRLVSESRYPLLNLVVISRQPP